MRDRIERALFAYLAASTLGLLVLGMTVLWACVLYIAWGVITRLLA